VALPAQHRLAPHQTVAAFWFAGQRESAPDVQIAMSLWDADHQKWGAPQWVVSRETLRQALGVQIRRLGNPVAWVDAQGRVHLFVVATGLGGWAASRVVHLIERPALKTNESQTQESAVAASIQFDVERILPLMPSVPMFNTSVLVRALPLALQDGGALLPVYFEIGRKYPIAVRLDAHGKMQSWVRMSERTDVLQPSVVPLSETQWLAFLRTGGERAHVGMTMTQDAGVHWQDIPDDSLGNPDSSVAALRVNDQMWLVHNPKDKGRQVLELSRATLPQAATNTQPMPSFAWQTQTIAQDQPGDEYSYPSMMLSQSSDHVPEVWISYTHLRQSIAYQRWQLQCTRRAGGRP
jgi:predicted neuraminidase